MKELSKGNISFVIPNEQPNQNEANVNVDIKDIRYGAKSVSGPEVTAIVNGSKIVSNVPFKEPFGYQFKRIEDEMIFKFAVTSHGDLLGFIYLEIPQKFKAMKRFKLDDWFPVKHLQTEEVDRHKKENFVARIVVEYTGMRKLELPKQGPKLPKAQMYADMVLDLKHKINEINQEMDEFNDEGYKHLATFEKKMLKKRINTNSKGQHPTKQVKVHHDAPQQDHQKELFYKTRTVFKEMNEVRVQALTPGQFYDHAIHLSKPGVKEGHSDCHKCENLTREIKHSHGELLSANQKITNLEQGKLTVDNDKLKKDMEKIQADIIKDRKEINIKLKDASTLLEQETSKVIRFYDGETTKAISSQNEATAAIEDLSNRLREIERREKRWNEQNQDIAEMEPRIIAKEEQLANDIKSLQEEREYVEDQEAIMAEMKNRMMGERQRVCEETNQLQFLKGDTELRCKQMKTLESFLTDEKSSFRGYVDKKNAEIEAVKQEIEEKNLQQENSFKEFEEQREEYEKKNKELLENINKNKLEAARLNREKNDHHRRLQEFTSDKKLIESEHKQSLLEYQRDYEFLEEKTRQLNDQKAEFDELNRKLAEFEVSLKNQSRSQQEQNSRFIIQQKQFYKRLVDTNFDLKELKKMAELVSQEIGSVDEHFEEHQKMERELTKSRLNMKKEMEILEQNKLKEIDDPEIAAAKEKRAAKNKGEGAEKGSNNAENKIKVAQEANSVLDKLFNEAVLAVYKKQNQQKDELIENLKESVVNLETKLQEMIKKIKSTKLNFFTAKNPNAPPKPIIVANPFANTSFNDSEMNASENKQDKSEDVDKSFEHQQERLMELQDNLEDLCDSTIQIVNQLSNGKTTQKSSERIEYLIETRKCFQNVFSILKKVNSRSKHVDTKDDFDYTYENFDIERLKYRLQDRLKELVDFIAKVKANNDFFNVAVDNEIIGSS